ncbi:MAG: DUF4397 domain-containing protein [Thermoflavifilum sp.]|nr:DUF4397 domain-containing protein [Thermoflavifilum sp.]
MKLQHLIACNCLAGLCSLMACTKNEIQAPVSSCTTCAYVKLVNGEPNSTATYQFLLNGQKITGSALAYAGIFPGTVEYAAVNAGQVAVAVSLGTDTTFAPVAQANLNLEAGKRYGILWTGDVSKDPFVLVENRTQPADSGYVMVQCVNLIQANQTVDILSLPDSTVVFAAIPYKGVKDYIKLPYAGTYLVRETGTHINLAKATLSLTQTRNYTWYVRGKQYDTLATSKTKITLDYYTNGYPQP